VGATTSLAFSLTRGSQIKGAVRDAATGKPLGDSIPVVQSASGDTVAGLTSSWYTTCDGTYTTRGLPAGSYFVRTRDWGAALWKTSDHREQLYDGVDCGTGCSNAGGTVVAVDGTNDRTGVDFATMRWVRRSDMNADRRSDILWRHTSGASYVWMMDGLSLRASTYLAPISASWQVQAVADFDGDREADILWRHALGALYVWLMDGVNLGPGSTYLPPIGTNWVIQALRDLDGDGKSDILWRESSSGSTYVWLMDGATTRASGYTTSQAGNDWTIQAPR